MDLKRPDSFSAPNFRFIQSDILKADIASLVREIGYRDGVLSDLAPQTSGIGVTDAARSLSLAESAFQIALAVLKEKGYFLCKVFEGGDLQAFRKKVLERFGQGRTLRPAAVRKASREVYLLGLGLRE